jgi:hypothetical protein
MAEPSTDKVHNESYQSNPFRPLLTTLGHTLLSNGVPGLQLVIALIVGVLVAYVGGLALLLILGHLLGLGVLLLGLLMVAAVLYVAARVMAGIFLMLDDSNQSKTGHWREYLDASAPYAWKLALTYVVVGLIVFAGLVLLIIPGFYLIGRLALVPLVTVLENLSLAGALKRSWSLTRGHAVEMIGAIFAGAVLGNGLLGQLTVTSSLYGRYSQLKELGPDGKPPVHWLNWFLVLFVPLFIAGIVALQFVAAAPGHQQPLPQDNNYYLETQ